MNNYYRVMLGRNCIYAEGCFENNFIGLYAKLDIDLSSDDSIDLNDFRNKYKPILMEKNPGRSKMVASNGCRYLYIISEGMNLGDIVLCPDGKRSYLVGKVIGNYRYVPDEKINHRRDIEWQKSRLPRSLMSQVLQKLTGIPATIVDISKFKNEIEDLLSGPRSDTSAYCKEDVDEPTNFALENHLEDFLVRNWASTELGKRYEIFEEDGELVGQQYQTDTGRIDILAISKDRKELLVVELKKGKASDQAVGQVLRYMGFVKAELAEENQVVKGVIVALEDSKKIRQALDMTKNIDFYRYEVSFRLFKNDEK